MEEYELDYDVMFTHVDNKRKNAMVMINTDIGAFAGEAHLDPEDEEIFSEHTGAWYAEVRAVLEYLKVKAEMTVVLREEAKDMLKYLERPSCEIKVCKKLQRKAIMEVYLEHKVNVIEINKIKNNLSALIRQDIENRPIEVANFNRRLKAIRERKAEKYKEEN